MNEVPGKSYVKYTDDESRVYVRWTVNVDMGRNGCRRQHDGTANRIW